MTRHSTIAIAAMLIASATSVAGAQRKTLVTVTGTIFHYLGDTIWSERDTTETRIVFHGDTVIRRSRVDGRELSEMTMLVVGDSAKILSSSRAGVQAPPSPANVQAMPRMVATAERDMLGTALEMERLRAGAPFGDRNTVPLSPPSPIRYVVSPATTIIHMADTVWYVRGCPNDRADTTTFLLFGQDSTRRLTPPRTFGQAMAVSLIAQMRMSLVRQQVAARSADLSRELPKVPDGCRAK